MSSSTIRKAIGVVKDQTSISLAKVAGNVAPDLEVLIVKATNHDTEPAEEKHIRDILHLISQHRGYVTASVYNISKRLNKTHDWVVALKALMLVHRLLVDGDPAFGQEMMYPTRKGTRVLNVSDFRAEALSSYWDHSAFVKNYSLYLDIKLEFIAFERKLTPLGFSHKSKSYGDLYESFSRVDKKETKSVMTPVKDMKLDRVLERLNKLIRLIERVLMCRPGGNAKSSKMVLAALYLVLNESFWIYADICAALGVLLDRFSEMEYSDCVKTFDEYVKAAKTIDELVEFYIWSKEFGVARASEFPQVHKVTDKILGTLERFLREKKNNLKKNIKENGLVAATGPTVAATENLLDLENDVAPPPVANHANWELALVGSTSDQAVLALPAPSEDKVEQVVDPRDPFAASLMVPPPPYVQLADLEKRKVFYVQEQQVWQPFGNNGMMGNHAGYNYAYY